jgi:hypothetical protein
MDRLRHSNMQSLQDIWILGRLHSKGRLLVDGPIVTKKAAMHTDSVSYNYL